MARKIIIADQHEEYVRRLVSYIQKQYGEKYEIETFNDKQQLKMRIEKSKCEILLFSPELYDASFYFKNVKLPVVLMEDDDEEVTYPDRLKWHINKYTRISSLLTYLEKEYEEVERNRPIIYSVYSPAGGVGKSTIAVAAALTYARAGKKVLYLNLEDIDGTGMFFDEKPVKPVFGKEFSEKDEYDALLAEMIMQDPKTKVMYLNRNALKVEDVFSMQLPFILERIIDDNMANIIVVEMNGSCEMLDDVFLNTIDYLMLVANTHTHAVYKLKKWLQMTQIEEKIKEKIKLVINQGKELSVSSGIDVIGRIDKLYATNPLGICEYIAQNQFLKLHGLL